MTPQGGGGPPWPAMPSAWLADALRGDGSPADEAFDRHMPASMRAISGMYWTPVAAALRAAEWFDELGVRSVVDIGSGVGKFCVAGALMGSAEFTGVEQRPHLVEVARTLARSFGVNDRVTFQVGVLGSDPIPAADAYYLYNPFGENLFSYGTRIGDDVELSEDRHQRDVAAAVALFEASPLGTYVLTYNGFGGYLPLTYHLVRVDEELCSVLRLWRKERTMRRSRPVRRHGPAPAR
jgi:SAM-dependent methyltransferase